MQYDEQKAMDTIINQGYLVNGYPIDDHELEAFRSGDDFFFRNWMLYNECVSEVKRALEECEQLKAIINVDKVLRESDGLTLDDFAAELALRTWAYYWDGMNECGLLEQIASESTLPVTSFLRNTRKCGIRSQRTIRKRDSLHSQSNLIISGTFPLINWTIFPLSCPRGRENRFRKT